MSEKKNIDRLFQERFKDFEANPPEFVWDNIREALEEKKKRRAVPIWFRYSGVAAGLVAAAFFGWQYLEDGSTPSNTSKEGNAVVVKSVSDESAKHVSPSDVVSPNAIEGNGKDINTLSGNPSTLVSTDKQKLAGKDNNSGVAPKAVSSKAISRGLQSAQEQSQIALGDKDSNRSISKRNITDTDAVSAINANHRKNIYADPSGDDSKGYASSDGKRKNKQYPNKTSVKKEANTETLNAIAIANKYTKELNRRGNQNLSSDSSRNPLKDNVNLATSLASNDNREINENNGVEDRVSTSLTVIDTTAVTKTVISDDTSLLATVQDTVKPAAENELEKLLREKESGSKEEKVADNLKNNRWNIKPQVAPVFYSSLSNGSPIDAQFASNSKNYDKDLSYGVGVNYAINERFSIRTGVNNLNLNYATQDIEFYASLNGATSNVAARTSRNAAIVVTTRTEGSGVGLPAGFMTNASSDAYSGSMIQTTGYIEVPLEMSYALLRKKFGIQVIGGLSTLFLNQNKVSVMSTQGLSTDVGEAQNLNDIHFSTNVGVGFKYKFFRAFEASFEPTFKYQVNTYSRDAGNFKPYFIGLYSGVSFSF